jgi:hypothetical protein
MLLQGHLSLIERGQGWGERREQERERRESEWGTHLCELASYCPGGHVSNHSPGIGQRQTRACQGHGLLYVGPPMCRRVGMALTVGCSPRDMIELQGRVYVIVRGSSAGALVTDITWGVEDGSYVQRWVSIFWYQFACMCSYVYVCS